MWERSVAEGGGGGSGGDLGPPSKTDFFCDGKQIEND